MQGAEFQMVLSTHAKYQQLDYAHHYIKSLNKKITIE